MSNDISKFITLTKPTNSKIPIKARGSDGSDIIQLKSYLTDGKTGLVQRAWGGKGADIFNVNFELPGNGIVGIDFNTENLKAMAEVLVQPDDDVRTKRIMIDTYQAVTGAAIDSVAAAASSIPVLENAAEAAAIAANLALDLATIAGHAELDIEEYNNDLADIDEFFKDPERQDWGTVNIKDARTVVEIKDFQVGIDTILLPSLPQEISGWDISQGRFNDGQKFVSLSFDDGSNSANKILRIGFKSDRARKLLDRPEDLINNLLVKSSSGWTIGKNIWGKQGNDASLRNGTIANDYLSIDEENQHEVVTLFGSLGDDILVGRLHGNDVLNGGDGNDYIQPGHGDDTIDGGKGYDRVNYSNLTNPITTDASEFKSIEGIIATEFDDRVNLSSLIVTNSDNEITKLISIRGKQGNDSLTGSLYDDLLDGGTGVDRMIGGRGNDVYLVDRASDEVIEEENQGSDLIKSNVSFSLENLSHVENLTLQGFSATPRVMLGKGNAGDNILKINDVSSPGLISGTLVGNAGNDTIAGSFGEDFLDGGAGNDVLNGGAGTEISSDYFGASFVAKDDDFTFAKGGYTSFDKYPRQLGDVNNDGRADIVAFGNDAVYTALSQPDGTFGEIIEAKDDDFTVNDRNYGLGWSSFDKYPRQLGDVNGDGHADIVAFAHDSVGVSLGQQDGTFGSVILAKDDDFTVNDRNYGLGWSSFDKYPRQLGDVNGDGRADIVAFAHDSVGVSLGQQDGTFGSVILAKDDDFTVKDNGYTSFARYPRQVADVNGDGYADIVAFSDDAVYTALGKADGTFGETIEAKNDDFTINNNSLGLRKYIPDYMGRYSSRQLGDVNGDGRADIVSFRNLGFVRMALGQPDGTFGETILAKSDDFTISKYLWSTFDKSPRQLADVNGDGSADIVGFGFGYDNPQYDNVRVALSLAPAQNDILTGGKGADTFVFDSLNAEFDLITDFSSAEGDKIKIGSEFGTTPRRIYEHIDETSGDLIQVGGLATTSPELFDYNSASGELSFDGKHFATLNTDSGFNISEDIVF